MCLYTNTGKPRVARKDMECYKIVRRHISGSICYKTGYIGKRIDDEIISGKREFLPDVPGLPQMKAYRFWKVAEGFVHTFMHKEDAEREASAMAKFYRTIDDSVVYYDVFKCIIPKGTLYYKGDNGHKTLTYASDKIVFKEIVSEH